MPVAPTFQAGVRSAWTTSCQTASCAPRSRLLCDWALSGRHRFHIQRSLSGGHWFDPVPNGLASSGGEWRFCHRAPGLSFCSWEKRCGEESRPAATDGLSPRSLSALPRVVPWVAHPQVTASHSPHRPRIETALVITCLCAACPPFGSSRAACVCRFAAYEKQRRRGTHSGQFRHLWTRAPPRTSHSA